MLAVGNGLIWFGDALNVIGFFFRFVFCIGDFITMRINMEKGTDEKLPELNTLIT
jgi:hypothetical protein